MITVYFESSVGAIKVATFEDEEIYDACVPTLEIIARDMGYIDVTEAYEEEKDNYSC
jgi:hypothetical protein